MKGRCLAQGIVAGTAAVAVASFAYRRIQKWRGERACEASDITVAIIGSGFSGIAAAYHLNQAGIRYVIYEKADEIGGTWNFNRYPGAACDIESFLYQLSFHMKTNWSSNFPSRDEILDYLKETVNDLGIRKNVKLGHEFLGADWDEVAKAWRIRLAADGKEFTAQHKFVVNATGPLHYPLLPTGIPGYGTFAGRAFHSAEWPAEGLAAVKGLRVGIIGSAASAAQIIPAIAPHVAHLTVFQRTPSWVLPRRDGAFGCVSHALLRLPLAASLLRFFLWVRHEVGFIVFSNPHSFISRIVHRDVVRHMRKQLRSDALRSALIPSYTMGCKRVVLSNGYLRAFNRDNVSLVTAPITAITETGVSVGGDASVPTTHDVDVLVFATGFEVMKMDVPVVANVRGRSGAPLSDRWTGYPTAYRGVLTADLPNWFNMLGPYSGLGHNSVVVMLEAQARYIARVLRVFTAPISPSDVLARLRLASPPSTVEVDLPTEMEWTAWCDMLHVGAVWQAGGCMSWYKRDGHVTALWPLSTQRYMVSMACAGLRGLTIA